ncbi:hypothetical protein CIK52_12570 [Kocuria rosea]|nr:hypothetical protein DEJ38_14610 [Kocuria rosea]PWF85046.1 hypothetical protein CIK52_12570 [Kocuria rosea]
MTWRRRRRSRRHPARLGAVPARGCRRGRTGRGAGRLGEAERRGPGEHPDGATGLREGVVVEGPPQQVQTARVHVLGAREVHDDGRTGHQGAGAGHEGGEDAVVALGEIAGDHQVHAPGVQLDLHDDGQGVVHGGVLPRQDVTAGCSTRAIEPRRP